MARVSAVLWRRPWARATLLLTPPLAWFVLLYLAALVVLLTAAAIPTVRPMMPR